VNEIVQYLKDTYDFWGLCNHITISAEVGMMKPNQDIFKYVLEKNRLSLADELKPGRVIWLRKKRPKNEPVQYKEIQKDSTEEALEEKKYEVQETSRAETPKPELTIGSVDTTIVLAVKDSALSAMVQPKDSVVIDSLSLPVSVDTVNTNENEEWPELVQQADTLKEVLPPAEIYIVEKGDTFYSISKKFNISVEALTQANALSLNSPLSIGQKLQVPKGINQQESVQAESDEITHTVKAGETLYQIARDYGVTVKEIMEWNDKDDFTVQIDEELTINVNSGKNN